ncbi:Hypothetical predicted protein [Pelobates cultripes]|uniref:Uncharacterized protein n=1 Tax=Pelobates cultripes TaxID=61616 RepID=A0AAD1W5N0_PELCU|nr:Hypothetical predicted protein [Pelobates cultripes]
MTDLRKELGERTSLMEHRMGEYAEAHNDMADHVQKLEHQLETYQVKLMDIENRSPRKNVRLRGIPEDIQQANIMEFLTGYFKTLVPVFPTETLLMDRAHRVAKPKFLQEETPRAYTNPPTLLSCQRSNYESL